MGNTSWAKSSNCLIALRPFVILTQRNAANFIYCLYLTFIPKLNYRCLFVFLPFSVRLQRGHFFSHAGTEFGWCTGRFWSPVLRFSDCERNGNEYFCWCTFTFYSNLTLSTDKMTSWVHHEENAKGEGHGFNSCRDSDFFFVPCLCHVDQFTFHSSLLDRAPARCSGGHGFNSCWASDFFFVPHLCHVSQFTFHISLPSWSPSLLIYRENWRKTSSLLLQSNDSRERWETQERISQLPVSVCQLKWSWHTRHGNS